MHIARSDDGGKIDITLALEVRFWIFWYQMKALDKAFLLVTPYSTIGTGISKDTEVWPSPVMIWWLVELESCILDWISDCFSVLRGFVCNPTSTRRM